ncbi:MAG: recombination protein RecR [Saprospiraceae bacterium]|nr:recombination protein RecR [Saprospiraceae bacterium]MBP7699296.1 recombination protein RecR [Saprospiraceae bacterium]
MNFSSKLVENAVNAFATLPGIGKKSALRLVLHLIKQNNSVSEDFCNQILEMRRQIQHCKVCHNLSDNELCTICSDFKRDKTTVCVVESIRDVMAIEETTQFKGTYHVLGGVISPIDGISPGELNIDSLLQRIAEGKINEIILAISPTIEGDTTAYFITKKINNSVKITTIARGISFGGELEYADEVTLGRSIVARIPYSTVSNEI